MEDNHLSAHQYQKVLQYCTVAKFKETVKYNGSVRTAAKEQEKRTKNENEIKNKNKNKNKNNLGIFL